LCSRLTIGITDRDFAAVIESGAGNENISMLSNFEQTLDCQCRHDMYEQTSGEGCSANVPTRKSLGRVVLGRRSIIGSHQPPLHHRAVPHISRNVQL
jgi:hypothetical protein